MAFDPSQPYEVVQAEPVKFDPSQPHEVISKAAPKFDPNQPFESISKNQEEGPSLSAATGDTSEPNWLERSWHNITGAAHEAGTAISERATAATKIMRANSNAADKSAGATNIIGAVGGLAAMLRPSEGEKRRAQRDVESKLGPDFVAAQQASETRKRKIGDTSGAEQLFGSDKSPFQLPLWSEGQKIGNASTAPLASPITKEDDNILIPIGASTVKLSTVKSVYQPFAKIWNMIASPGGMLTAGLGSEVATAKAGTEAVGALAATKPIETATTAYFTKDMTEGSIQQLAELPKILADPDKTNAQKFAATADTAAGVGLTMLGANHFSNEVGIQKKVSSIIDNRFLSTEGKIDEIAKATGKTHDEIVLDAGKALEEKSKQVEKEVPKLPEVPKGNIPIKRQRADGTVYDAVMNGYWNENTPSVGRAVKGGWSHGMLAEGEKIITDVPTEAEFAKLREANNAVETPAATKDKFKDNIEKAGYKVRETGGFTILTDSAGKEVREADVPADVHDNFRAYREAQVLESSKPAEITAKPELKESQPDSQPLPKLPEQKPMNPVDKHEFEQSLRQKSVSELRQLRDDHESDPNHHFKDIVDSINKVIAEKSKSLGEAAEPTETAPPATEESATPTEVTKPSQLETTGGTTGIAQRVLDTQNTGIEPGEGVSARDAVIHGEALLQNGFDPVHEINHFEKTGTFSGDPFDVITASRAYERKLAKAAQDAAEKFGPDSPEYKAAADARLDWRKRIKPLATKAHEMMTAHQGEQDINTGSFHELENAVRETTGKDLTPKQSGQATEIAEGVKKASNEAQQAKEKALRVISEAQPKVKVASGIRSMLREQAEAARLRIRQRLTGERTSATLGADVLADYAIIAAEHIAKGVETVTDLSKKLVTEFGDAIKPHVQAIWDAAKKHIDGLNEEKRIKFLDSEMQKVEKQIKEEAPFTPERTEPISTEKTKPLEDRLAALKEERQNVRDRLQPKPHNEPTVLDRAKIYINAGELDPAEIVHKIATDMGVSIKEVAAELGKNMEIKRATDEMWQCSATQRRLTASAKQWVADQANTSLMKPVSALNRGLFKLQIFGHGTAWLASHASALIMQPQHWRQLLPRYFESFKFMNPMDKGAYHEARMNELTRDPNYAPAQRAGLENNPYEHKSDYESPWLKGWFKELGLAGNRGYDALKLLRQDLFNKAWEKLPNSLKTPDYAQMLAESINHATGATKSKGFGKGNALLFAARLKVSQFQLLVGDTAKATETAVKWIKDKDSVTPVEKAQAIRQYKQMATIVGVHMGLLALNQAMLSASGSRQKVNMTDPTKPDFMAFKGFGMQLGATPAITSIVRLFGKMLAPQLEDKKWKGNRFAQSGGALIDYARGQTGPLAHIATDLAAHADIAGRPLPFSKDNVPEYLLKEGIKTKYSWPEYIAGRTLPIPAAEAVGEVWSHQGLSKPEISLYLKAIAESAFSAGGGMRLSEDMAPSSRSNLHPIKKK